MEYSYDIFDTCLLRKCGTPDTFFDVLSTKVFQKTPTENERQEFICHRLFAESSVNGDGKGTLQQIYEAFEYRNLKLFNSRELYDIELQCERDMLVPSHKIKSEIDILHSKGKNLIFISDMYLPKSFLKDILLSFNLFHEGDRIYVSSEIGKTKSSGDLYEYIKNVENINYHNWIHSGDNLLSDIKIPRSLGIKTREIRNEYSFLQRLWLDSDYSLTFKTKSIAAGLSRSVLNSNDYSSHSAFVTDLIAPLLSSWTYKILSDSKAQGIKRVFFCARDAYQQYKVALILQKELFPDIECKFLYISRQAISSSDPSVLLQYFEQEGLAGKDKVAIVDARSQGRTQHLINTLLSQNGYEAVKGYYFEIFPCLEIKYDLNYSAEVNKIYALRNNNFGKLFDFDLEGPLFEVFFAMNNLPKTIDYKIDNHLIVPVFNEKDAFEDCWNIDAEKWMSIHTKLITEYTQGFVQTGLFLHSETLFNDVSIFSLNSFFDNPKKEYLQALTQLICYENQLPYINGNGFIAYVKSRGHNCVWKEGTVAYCLTDKSRRLYYLFHHSCLFKFLKTTTHYFHMKK